MRNPALVFFVACSLHPLTAAPAAVTVDLGRCLPQREAGRARRAGAAAAPSAAVPQPAPQCRAARQVGSGVLLSINQSQPRPEVVAPLGLRNHRGDYDNLPGDYGRLRSMGMDGSVQSVLMDLYFGRGQNPPAVRDPWPGDGGNWTSWIAFVKETVAAAPEGVSFDIWNEPVRL